MHIGGHIGANDAGQEIGASNADGGNRRVQPVPVGLCLGGAAGDLAHGAAQQFEVKLGVDTGGVNAVGLDPDLGVGAQSQAPLIDKDDHGQGVGPGDDAVALAERVAQLQW